MYEFFPGNYMWSYNVMLALAAGGQVGDIALMMPKLSEHVGDDEVWHEEWDRLSKIVEKRAHEQLSEQSASEAMYLACLYQIMAEHFVPPQDPKRSAAYNKVLEMFDWARQRSQDTLEYIEIPFEGSFLPAYFQPAMNTDGPAPAVIMICGLDTTKELWYLRAKQELAKRGVNVLYLDTPGIGGALRKNKLYTRYDYEVPVGAGIDFLESRAEVDGDRIGIIGSSLGGYYVSRAAAYEPRLKAVAAWGAIYDYYHVWEERLASRGTLGAPVFQLCFITGKETIEDAVAHVENFRIQPFADKVTQPFLVMHGADDKQIPMADAQKMYDALINSEREMIVFDGNNGGASHTQFDNHAPAMAYVSDWMAAKL